MSPKGPTSRSNVACCVSKRFKVTLQTSRKARSATSHMFSFYPRVCAVNWQSKVTVQQGIM
eukprot:1189288-Amphidinium_carterae.2